MVRSNSRRVFAALVLTLSLLPVQVAGASPLFAPRQEQPGVHFSFEDFARSLLHAIGDLFRKAGSRIDGNG